MEQNEKNTQRPRAVRRVGTGGESPKRSHTSARSEGTHSAAQSRSAAEQSGRTARTDRTAQTGAVRKTGGTHTKTALHRGSSRSRTVRGKDLKQPKPTAEPDNTALSSVVKAVIYIVAVLAAAATLSYYGITIGNDVFALKKSDEVVDITVDADVDVETLAKQLADKGVIRYPKVFVFYAELRHKTEGFIATTETVSPSMDYDQLLAAFKEKAKPTETVRIRIPEGSRVDDIITLFVDEYGIGTREGFIDAIQNYPFDYWFVKELDESTTIREGRKYRLEGYLYPDTYYFYTTSSEVTVINKLLANFENKFASKFVDRAKEIGWTIDDVVILASMIQMEAKYESDYGRVSSVFHNRLSSNKTQGKLESDATIAYVLEDRSTELTNELLNLDSPYNTRLYEGLPPGPIVNVTLYAINYALYPTSSNYYYFVSRPGGYILYAETYAGHLKNIQRVEYEEEHGELPDW